MSRTTSSANDIHKIYNVPHVLPKSCLILFFNHTAQLMKTLKVTVTLLQKFTLSAEKQLSRNTILSQHPQGAQKGGAEVHQGQHLNPNMGL